MSELDLVFGHCVHGNNIASCYECKNNLGKPMSNKTKEEELNDCFELDYPENSDNDYVGSLYDIYKKAFISGYSKGIEQSDQAIKEEREEFEKQLNNLQEQLDFGNKNLEEFSKSFENLESQLQQKEKEIERLNQELRDSSINF